MAEEWKNVPWASNYAVSDQGRVQNRQTGRILKINRNRGRSSVNIRSDSGKYITKAVSNIQAEAFDKPLREAGRPKGSKSKLKKWVIDPTAASINKEMYS